MFQAILCDDNEIILEGLSSQIKWKDLGIELTATAADGNEAWELIQKNPPDLLITDIRMPYIQISIPIFGCLKLSVIVVSS